MTKPRVFKYQKSLPEFLRDDEGELYGNTGLGWVRVKDDFLTIWRDDSDERETYNTFWELLAVKGRLTEAFRPAAKPGDVIHTVEELNKFPNGTVLKIEADTGLVGIRVKISSKWFNIDSGGYSSGSILEDERIEAERMVLEYVPS